MRDATARRLGLAALLLATWGIATSALVPGRADSLSEPDAYQLRREVQVLQATVEEQGAALAGLQEDIDSLYSNDAILDKRTTDAACFAWSDYHYVRETLNGSKKKYRLPLVVYTCKKNWKPKPRLASRPLHLEVPRAAR